MCEQKLYDAGDVWRIAMQQENSQALFILPPFVELTAREKDFVTKRAGENFVLLAVPTEKSIPAEYDFFRAIGAANEIAALAFVMGLWGRDLFSPIQILLVLTFMALLASSRKLLCPMVR